VTLPFIVRSDDYLKKKVFQQDSGHEVTTVEAINHPRKREASRVTAQNLFP